MPPNSPLALSFFGGFEVRRDGRPVAGINYDKMRALLAYLAMEPARTHHRESLAVLLWESSSLETGRGNLRRTLADLRRVLEPPGQPALFEVTRQTIRFASDCPVDALLLLQPPGHCASATACYRCDACIAHLQRVADLYRGEFLAGLSLPECPEFEDWLAMQRESLLRRAQGILEQLAGHYEQAGNLEQAIVSARRLAELDPWQEAVHRRLMRLLACNRQQGAALAQFENCRALLRKELGVQPSEETQVLFKAITRGELRPVVEAAPAFPPALISPSVRRQVTVVYCELSTPDTDDPEDALQRLHEPQSRCGDIIRAHGGHIIQSHGGGLLAYFGYPEAREDAARQAVGAALALAAAAMPASVRCGVHTGLIVTTPGHTIPDAAGQTSNRAIQLRLAAQAGEVAVSESTYRLVTGYFHGRKLNAPGDGYLIGTTTGAMHRLEAAASLAPFTGRVRELGQLLAHWESVSTGTSAVVLLRGEPGMGKSRLVMEVKRRLPPENVLECRCMPNEAATPFHPLMHWLTRYCGFVNGDTGATRRAKLDSTLEGHPFSRPDAAQLLAALMGLPVDRAELGQDMDRSEQRQALMQTLAEVLLPTGRKPLLLVFEDMHWADSSTLELLHLLVTMAEGHALLLLLTARPEFDGDGCQALTMDLNRLPEVATRELAASLAHGLTESQTRRIAELSDGIPLFIEELAHWSAANAEFGAATVPLTLHDLLMARIDQLGAAMRTAQVAAAIGREFEQGLLTAVLEECGEMKERHLADLLRSGLVTQREAERFQFKHALIQEAAYQSQPKALRGQTHRIIARALQRDYADTCLQIPEILAHHLTEAGEIESAIEYWRKAGQNASRHSGDREAARHYRQALHLLELLPASTQRDCTEVSLQLALGTTLNAVLGYAAADTRQAFDRAQELTRQVGSNDEQFRALYGGMWTSLSNHTHAREVTELLIDIAESSRQPMHRAMAYFANLTTIFWMSPFHESRRCAERVIALCHGVDNRDCIAIYGENPLSSTLSFLSRSLWFEGYADRAVKVSDEALAEARCSQFTHGLCLALAFACQLYRCLRQPQRVEELGGELQQLAEQHNLELWRHTADCHAGWALSAKGTPAGINIIQSGLAGIRRTLPRIEISYAAILMDAHAHLGQHENLLREIDAILITASQRNDQYLLPELTRLKGEALLATDPAATKQAAALFRQALTLANDSGAKALALRVAISLVKMEPSVSSREILKQTMAEFEEGFATADYLEALAVAKNYTSCDC